jgi:hypothetical protein
VRETELERLANKQSWGVAIQDLAAAAQSFGLEVEIVRLDLETCAKLLSAGVFPIVYLNRLRLKKPTSVPRKRALANLIPHAVVPVRLSREFITYNDPLSGTRRRSSRRNFERAQADMAYWCLICKTP